MKTLFEEFSQQANEHIIKARKDKLKEGADLYKLYMGQQAVDMGIADGLGRVHKKML